MRRLRRAALLAAVLIATACSTQYRPRIPLVNEGFEEERIGWRTWTIWVGVGWQQELPRLGQYALFRAAEIATAHGLNYFAVREGGERLPDLASFAPYAADSAPLTPLSGTEPSFGQRLGFRTRGPGPESDRVHVVRLRIRLLEDGEIARHETVVDARKVLVRLEPIVRR